MIKIPDIKWIVELGGFVIMMKILSCAGNQTPVIQPV
jgi:hypothetical protein